MDKQYTFQASIEGNDGGGAFVTVPFDAEKAFGKKRIPVQATIDGEPYRGTLVRMGSDSHMLIVLKEIRQKIGKQIGDAVDVVLMEATEPRELDIPDDVVAALADAPEAKAYFDELAFSHRREYMVWVTEAKRPETRQRRIVQMLEMLAEKRKRM